MAAEGMQFTWRWKGGTIFPNLDVIWGMSNKGADRRTRSETPFVLRLSAIGRSHLGNSGLSTKGWCQLEAGIATEEEVQEACDVVKRMAADPKWIEFFESLERRVALWSLGANAHIYEKRLDKIGLTETGSPLRREMVMALNAEEASQATIAVSNCVKMDGTILDGATVSLYESDIKLNMNKDRKMGYFDIMSIKTISCNINGVSIYTILKRQWKFFAEDLNYSDIPVIKNGIAFNYRIYASGANIKVIAILFDNVLIEANDPRYHFYDTSGDACIDILFKDEPANDEVLHSRPDEITFCAGGECIDKNPGLDASM